MPVAQAGVRVLTERELGAGELEVLFLKVGVSGNVPYKTLTGGAEG